VLHITNGESVSISETGLSGRVVFWNDTLHDGPVPHGLPLQELSRVRERFIADFFKLEHSAVSFAERDAAIASFRDHEEVVLWFEHDLYDQLQLIQVLGWFSERKLGSTKLTMVSTDSYLGPMKPEGFARLFETRHRVTEAELQTAASAWDAFTLPVPMRLEALLDADTAALPFLRDALLRYLQQCPALGSGLSRTEERILRLAESGIHEFAALFAAEQKLEDRVWLGDATFQRYLNGLETARLPSLMSTNDEYDITPFGREVLQGREDHVLRNGINRWLGGVHLCDGAPLWRWDEAEKRIRP
jgi:hypothetical protein